MTPQEMVTEFHRMFDCAVDDRSSDVIGSRMDLIAEEYTEMMEELGEALVSAINGNPIDNLPYVAKEMADLVYMIFGTAISVGVDLDAALKIVHESNMSKLWSDGRPRIRFDGKILKPPTYQEPNLEGVVKEL